MKKIAILMTLVLVLSMGAVFADVAPGEASITETDRGTYNPVSADTLNATGGSIFTANLTSNVSTIRWAGISGTVAGDIVLGDDSDATMYTWVGATPVAVYATLNADTIDWAGGLNTGTEADFETDFDFLNTTNAPNDNYAITFSGTTDLVSNMFTALSAPSALTEDGVSDSFWVTLHTQDGAGQTVLVGQVDSAGHTNYANVAGMHYQMIIPELGGQGEDAKTEWDLWVELE